MGSSWKVIFAFVGVFVAGAVFGGFFTVRSAGRRWAEREARLANQPASPTAAQPPAGNRANNSNNPNRGGGAFGQITPVILGRLATQLKLTDEQKEKIKPIVTRAEEDMQYLRRENFRSTTRVLERMHGDISVLLTEEQRAELEVLKKNIQDRMARAEKEQKERRDEKRKEQGGANRSGGDAAVNTTPAPTPKGN